jgi:hypothetical protein
VAYRIRQDPAVDKRTNAMQIIIELTEPADESCDRLIMGMEIMRAKQLVWPVLVKGGPAKPSRLAILFINYHIMPFIFKQPGYRAS